MMRHDQRPTSPLAVDYNHHHNEITTTNHQFRRPADVMRCINEVWRHKSNSPSISPRSHISKAFDFWPWQRNKKAITLSGHQQDNKLSTDDHHKNIFRNGGIIRDILSDKSNKTKPKDDLMLIHRQNNVSSQKKKGRKLARNKSLDINEIIDEVSNQNNDSINDNQHYNDNNNENNYNHKNKTCFLDDTFIENILRNSQDDDDYYDDDDDNNHNNDIENNSDIEQDKNSNDKKHNAENLIPKNCSNNCQRHILFNDENIVYLIRKEKPVKHCNHSNNNDENTKTRSASLKLKNMKMNNDEINSNDGNIIKERFKLKKMLSKDDTIDIGKQHSLNSNIKLSSPSLSVNKRGILYRHNSTDTQQNTNSQNPTSQNNNNNNNIKNTITNKPSTNNSDIILENINNPINNSNNSSGSSIGGNSVSGGAGAGAANDTPKSNRPRKKLSFRDPVVSQRKNELLQKFDAAARNNCRKMISSTPINNNQHENCCCVNGRNCNCSCGSGGSGCCNDINMKTNCSLPNDFELESHAMRIVRTVGQAFEVCHKFNLQKNSLDNNDERSDISSEILDADRISEQLSDEDIPKKDQKKTLTRTNSQPDLTTPQRPNHLELLPVANNNIRKSPCSDGDKSPTSPISSSKEIHKLKDQLEQQAIQTRQALAQLMLVREQLISETNARIEAQARTQQLLQQNRELLEHLASLGGYSEPNQTGLTSANIGLAPQTQIQMLLQEQQQQQQSTASANDLSATLQKAFLATSNNNNLASINQQLSNLGSINQQLTTLSNQLSGLNQQSQNLQNFQNLNAIQQTTQNAATGVATSNSNAFPSLSQIQTISNKLNNISQQNQHEILSQKELFQMNQELLNRLNNMNLGNSPNNNSIVGGGGGGGNSPHNSFFYANPMSNCSPNNNNNNNNNFSNFLNSPNNLGNLTPSPLGTMTRNSYSNSPLLDNDIGSFRLDKNLNSNSLDDCHFIKPLSQVGTLTTLDSDGKVKVIVPISNGGSTGQLISGDGSSCSRSDLTPSPNNNNNNGRYCGNDDQRYNLPNTVTLKITDESGNITNSRKLSATPSFITRSTSEKVPNRSQMMSQVQRTAWARHTTK